MRLKPRPPCRCSCSIGGSIKSPGAQLVRASSDLFRLLLLGLNNNPWPCIDSKVYKKSPTVPILSTRLSSTSISDFNSEISYPLKHITNMLASTFAILFGAANLAMVAAVPWSHRIVVSISALNEATANLLHLDWPSLCMTLLLPDHPPFQSN